MDLYTGAEKALKMDDATWMRHANPSSVWTRLFTMMPLLSLAIWSRDWIGWYALLAVAAVGVWVWYNPRAFAEPKSTDNWGSKGTFGERIFLETRKTTLPAHHVRAANVLTFLSLVGMAIWIYGLVVLDFWAVVAGIIGIGVPKAWFVDRMVWIYDEQKDTDPRYASWLR